SGYTDWLTTASNTLEFYVPTAAYCMTCGNYWAYFQTQNLQDKSAYSNGHIEFDMMLGQPVSNYTWIQVFIGGSNNTPITLNLSTLSASSFSHVSVSIATLGGVENGYYDLGGV